MIRRCLARVALVALLAGFATLAVPVGAGAQNLELAVGAIDTSDFPEVSLEFSVPPRFDATVALDDVRLTENGVPRTVSLERVRAERLQIVMAIDTSGSMAGAPIQQARLGARRLVETLPGDTEVAVIGFGDRPTILSGLTDGRDAALRAIDAMEVDPNAETALYDATTLATRQLEPSHGGPQYLVVLSDGGDTASAATFGSAQAAVQAAGVPFFAVSLVTRESAPAILQELADETGGGVIEANDAQGLADLTGVIAEAIIDRYQLVYTSLSGGRALVEVTVAAGEQVASGRVRLDLPVLAPSTPTMVPVPTQIATGAGAEARPAESTTTADVGPSWYRPAGIAMVGVALVILCNYLLWPTRRRHNPLHDIAPLAGRVARESRGVFADLAHNLVGSVDRVLRRNTGAGAVAIKLERAGVRMRPAEYVVGLGAAVLGAFLVGLVVNPVAAVMLASAVAVAGWIWLNVKGDRRSAAFDAQLAPTLQMMSGALRAGFSISQVVALVSTESSAPMRDEFARLGVEEVLGRDVTESFRDVAHRMRSRDFEWVAEAIEINRTVGGDLAEVLDNVAGTIRTRARIAGEIRTLSAEGRLSAVILTAIPFVITFGQAVTNPELSRELTGTSEGRALIVIALVMVTVGATWMRRVIRLKY